MNKIEKARSFFIQGLKRFNEKNYEDAILNFLNSLKYMPDRLSTLTNLTASYIKINDYDKAQLIINKLNYLYPSDPFTFLNQGNIFEKQGKLNEALAFYNNAVNINNQYCEAIFNKANILTLLNRLDEAIIEYEKLLALEPDFDYLLGTVIHIKMLLCDWERFDERLQLLKNKIQLFNKATPCFPIITIVDSLELHQKVSNKRIKDLYPVNKSLGEIKNTKNEKIRIGYFSTDFHNHATSYLMAKLFELHDKKKFEIYAFSFGAIIHDEMRERLINSFDHFVEVGNKSPKEIAMMSRQLGIDIAIDLKGHTLGHKIEIFSYRAAPIQINYLGYPGSTGAEYIDYIIADKVLIPENLNKFYSEKIIYLPNSYQVNDDTKKIASINLKRKEFCLPSDKFIFCCFNNNYKILPSVFKSWINILNRVPNSILWLLKDNTTAYENLIESARTTGLDPSRIIFSPRIELSIHLARHQLADLFLDTFPCNAHTTASDALWAGLPVLTRIGESFASRVAASLLSSIGLHELITTSESEYEDIAVQLALNKDKLFFLKSKLHINKKTMPLFDTAKFAKHIENAYESAYRRYHSGAKPSNLYISE